jgi:Holliday junction resolvase RusA-like endonuclease
LKITLFGDMPSKKNSRRAIFVKGRTIFIANKRHEEWHKRGIRQLLGKSPVQGQIEGIELILYPSSKRKSDLTNKAESIMDLLVDAGIIEDDNWFIVPDLHLKFGGIDRNNPRCEITINQV